MVITPDFESGDRGFKHRWYWVPHMDQNSILSGVTAIQILPTSAKAMPEKLFYPTHFFALSRRVSYTAPTRFVRNFSRRWFRLNPLPRAVSHQAVLNIYLVVAHASLAYMLNDFYCGLHQIPTQHILFLQWHCCSFCIYTLHNAKPST